MTATSKRGRIPNAPRPEPWKPVDYDIADVAAVQALAHGRATEEQQRCALAFIVRTICAKDDLSYRSDNPHDTSFAEGRRFVGLQISKFVNLNLSRLQGKHSEQGEATPTPENGQ